MAVVTVGLLTYNRPHLVSRAVESVMNQTFADFELIISDDSKNDDTEKVVKPYLSDKRVSYTRQRGIGMTKNFIETLRLGNGEYFMWLCDDDYISDNYIEKNLEVLRENQDYILSAGLTIFFSSTGVWDKKDVLHLEEDDPAKRLFRYFKHVDNNVILYGLMRRNQVTGFEYPDTFGADLLWSCQLAYAGKVKILDDCYFYYSKEGISQDTDQLASYYNDGRKKKVNPYRHLRRSAYQLISARRGAFKSLSFFRSKIIAVKVWMIIRDRFCISALEANMRRKLRLGTRLKAFRS
jgi:glycosyltransferase involved in cell wall biosynthesis